MPEPVGRMRIAGIAGWRGALRAAGMSVCLFVLPPAASAFAELRPGTVFRDCPECPEMVAIPAGRFTMGAPPVDRGIVPGELHPVAITSFALGKYEVTRGEFAAFVRETGHSTEGGCLVWIGAKRDWSLEPSKSWREHNFAQSDRHPVVCTNWTDAKAYAAWLSRKTGKAYRLPSEAEWEYAARAGTTTRLFWGDDPGYRETCRHANGADRSATRLNPFWVVAPCDDGHEYTAPAGSFAANRFGLHDMSGNAWEWVEDCWNGDYLGAPSDGRARLTGDCSSRPLRGGSWNTDLFNLHSAERGRAYSTARGDDGGFRVARSLD